MESQEEISLLEILIYLKKGLGFIIFCTMIGGGAGVLGTKLLEEEVYEAFSTVLMAKETVIYDNPYTKSDLELYQQTGNTYMEIASSNAVIDRTAHELSRQDINLSRSMIRSMVSAQHISGTLIIRLSAKGSEGEEVFKVVNAYRKSFIEVVKELLPVSSLQVIDEAEEPSAPNSSKLPVNTVIGSLIGGVLSCGSILLKCIFDMSRIRTAEEVRELTGLEVITHIR